MTADDRHERARGGRRTRRQFLTGLLRHAAFGGLAAMGVALGARSRDVDDSQTCIGRGICRGCTVYESCLLPQAQSAKYAAEKKANASRRG